MLSSCFFLIGIRFTCKKNFRKTFQSLLGRIPRRFLWSITIFDNSSFHTFPGISQNLPENVSIFFAKMIDLCLLTQKNQTSQGVIGWNIALWQNLWVGVGWFERPSSSTRTRRLRSAACSISSGRHILDLTMRRALRKWHVFDFVPSYLQFRCPWMLSWSLNVFFRILIGVFLISVKPLTTENTENNTTPKICKITVVFNVHVASGAILQKYVNFRWSCFLASAKDTVFLPNSVSCDSTHWAPSIKNAEDSLSESRSAESSESREIIERHWICPCRNRTRSVQM